MSDPSITGPEDDENLGHGGVEVPTDEIADLPQANPDDVGDDVLPGSVGGGDGGGGSDALGGEPDDTL